MPASSKQQQAQSKPHLEALSEQYQAILAEIEQAKTDTAAATTIADFRAIVSAQLTREEQFMKALRFIVLRMLAN